MATYQPQLQAMRLKMLAFATSRCTIPNLLGGCEILLLPRLDLISIRPKNIKGIGELLMTMEASALKILERFRVKVELTR